MLPEDDFDLTAQYYRLRGEHIYYQHVLDNYRRYGALAPVLAQFSSLCDGFVHDLGNGLNAIRSKLERLSVEQTISDSDHAQAITKAITLCESCGSRLYALHEISPQKPIIPEPANLPVWIPRILDTLNGWLPPSVQVKFYTTESRLIVADYDHRLGLALSEPLLNARQALSKGGKIDVFLQRLDNGLAQIEITDNGPGLSGVDPEQCFNLRFTTGPNRYGVGLYVARKIVEKHRGTFQLWSEPGKGTHVVIQLPVGNPEPDWDDESALVQALENLHDTVAEQQKEIERYETTYNLSREQMLAQLSDLFGQLSTSIVQFTKSGLADIRRLLLPLVSQVDGEVLDNVQFIMEKCDYCDLVLGNARALDSTLTIQPTPLDLNKIILKTVQLMTWRFQPGTQLNLSQITSLPSVYANASLISTAFLNLLRNAIDVAGREGEVGVQTLSADETVIIRFTNTGQTIPPDQQGRIFDLDYTTRPRRKFGLGLHVAQAIIIKHGGLIRVLETNQSHTDLEIALPRHK